MIGLLVMLVVVAALAMWDRRSPVSASPDGRLVRIGVVLAVIGGVTSIMFWWLVWPMFVFLAGAALIVVGRHRVVTA
jgi:hypothetical protein